MADALRCETEEECNAWIEAVRQEAEEAGIRENRLKRQSALEQLRTRTKEAYDSDRVQMGVAVLITLSFVASVAEAEILPEEGTPAYRALWAVDLTFTLLFAVELAVNLFAHWFLPFFADGWNLFDAVVVATSITTVALDGASGFNVMRLMRVFRVLRVFRRLSSLRVLIKALTSSIIPVVNAFAVFLLVTSIYSVLGVMLWRHRNEPMFGSFSSSLFTMVQVCTGDSWASNVVRPMFRKQDAIDMDIAIFFVSYILIVSAFLINIVIAVLLDEFISSVESEKSAAQEELIREHELEFVKAQGALDPVLATLTAFSTPEALDREIDALYDMMDQDGSGGLTFEEFQAGLQALPYEPRIYVSQEDFDLVTDGQRLLNADGEVDRGSFAMIMRQQLGTFVHKLVAHKMRHAPDEHHTLLLVLKQILLRQPHHPAPARPASAVPAHHTPPAEVAEVLGRVERLLGAMEERMARMEEEWGGQEGEWGGEGGARGLPKEWAHLEQALEGAGGGEREEGAGRARLMRALLGQEEGEGEGGAGAGTESGARRLAAELARMASIAHWRSGNSPLTAPNGRRPPSDAARAAARAAAAAPSRKPSTVLEEEAEPSNHHHHVSTDNHHVSTDHVHVSTDHVHVSTDHAHVSALAGGAAARVPAVDTDRAGGQVVQVEEEWRQEAATRRPSGGEGGGATRGGSGGSVGSRRGMQGLEVGVDGVVMSGREGRLALLNPHAAGAAVVESAELVLTESRTGSARRA